MIEKKILNPYISKECIQKVKIMRLRLFIPTFIIVFFAASSCVVQESPVTGNKRAYAYSWSQEVELGNQVDPEIVTEFGLYNDTEIENYFKNLSEVILEQSHMRREDTPQKFRETEFTFRVLDSPVVNAFALPGGFVYVTRGLMAHLNNEAQLAVVIGHEIGHVAARHASQRGLQQTIGQVAVIGGAILGQELLGIPGESILNLSSQAAQLIFLSYSRDHERESDRLGVEYAAMTGYAAEDGAAFFTSLKRISEKSGGGVPNLLSSHPDPGERELTIPRRAEEWREKGYEQTVRNTNTYMQMLNGMVYSNNPRNGFERDGNFYHPDLKFLFPVPAQWQVVNQPSQVIMVSQEQDGVMIFRIDGESTGARESVQNFLESNEITTEDQRSLTISGSLPAYEANFTIQQENQTLGVNMFAIEFEENIYRFINYTQQSKFDTYLSSFRETTTGFNRLRNQEILNINPVTLRVVRNNREARFRDLLPDALPMEIDAEEVAIINQVHLDDVIPVGNWIKIPVQ